MSLGPLGQFRLSAHQTGHRRDIHKHDTAFSARFRFGGQTGDEKKLDHILPFLEKLLFFLCALIRAVCHNLVNDIFVDHAFGVGVEHSATKKGI